MPTIALLAHVDTAPQFPGKDVKPIVHRSYDGEDIVLPDDPAQVLSPKALPYLAQKVGDDIVTASGTTLLGADDKAGIAIIMAAARHLLQNARTCRTARSASASRPTRKSAAACMPTCRAICKADFAYTLDGAHLGEIVYETFSADAAKVNVKGVSIHPGWAKDKLVNATHLAAKIVDTLPQATLHAGDDFRPPGLHPCHRYERLRGRDEPRPHPARFRARGIGGPGRAA